MTDGGFLEMSVCTLQECNQEYDLGVFIQETSPRAVVSSRDVARIFEKEHFHVLRDIKTLDCSDSFRTSNFGFTSKTVAMPNGGTREDLEYLITRDGFAFLAMGFTGTKAARFKEAYINRFNKMEEALKNPLGSKQLTITDLIEISRGYVSQYVMNRLVLQAVGQPIKQVRTYDQRVFDQVSRFIEECCEVNEFEPYRCSRSEFYACFRKWCKEQGEMIPSVAMVSRTVNKMARFQNIRTSRERCWGGIKC